jgi:hypothetical protein
MRRSLVLPAAVAVLGIGLIGCTSPPGAAPGNVATVVVGGETVTVTVPAGLTVHAAVDTSKLPPAPPGVTFPIGALDIEVSGAVPGAIVPITESLPTPVDLFRKLVGGTWDRFRFDGLTGSTVSADGRTITIDVQDGGRGDDDGTRNGSISDPGAPGDATVLTIISNDLPIPTVGVPYSFQLEAAGAAGPLTWQLLRGDLPDGISLSADGLLSGTPTGVTPGGPIRVQADDGVSQATKLLALGAQGTPTAHFIPRGNPLPTGLVLPVSRTDFPCNGVACGRASLYEANGSLDDLTTTSIASLATFQGNFRTLSPDGSRLIMDTQVQGAPPNGPVDVVDAETGATLATVVADPSVQVDEASFSPDGSKIAIEDANSFNQGAMQVFDVGTYALRRSVPIVLNGFVGFVWSPDSSELVNVQVDESSPTMPIYSASSAGLDRTIPTPRSGGSACRHVFAWSSTNRLAATCGFALITLAASDGGDVHTVASSSSNCSASCSLFGDFRITFSPDGSNLAFEMIDYTGGVEKGGLLVAAPDANGALNTPLVEFTPAGLVLPIAWN